MMNDWTEIIGEELREAEVPLPADDWDVLQRRHAAVRRRRRLAVWSWTGGVAAAVVAVALVLFGGDGPAEIERVLVAESEVVEVQGNDSDDMQGNENDQVQIVPDSPEYTVELLAAALSENKESAGSGQVCDTIDEVIAVVPEDEGGTEDNRLTDEDVKTEGGVTADEKVEDEEGREEVPSDVMRDGDGSREDRLLADLQDFPEYRPRRRIRMSVAASGTGLSGGIPLIPKVMDPGWGDAVPPADPGYEDTGLPGDTSVVSQPSMRYGPALMNSTAGRDGRRILSTDYDHFQPLSLGISVRFAFTDRFSLNTGVNYTLYSSRKKLMWSDGSEETLDQRVHYIGIPVRCDWLLVDRKHFGLYLGVGAQVDKAVYAKAGTERLRDRTFLLSVNGVLGLQYNITDRFGLYLEPELTGNLNRPDIKTFRSDRELMLSVRAGLRVNL